MLAQISIGTETVITVAGMFFQGLIALSVYAIRSEIKNVREVLTVRIDDHARRLDNLEIAPPCITPNQHK